MKTVQQQQQQRQLSPGGQPRVSFTTNISTDRPQVDRPLRFVYDGTPRSSVRFGFLWTAGTLFSSGFNRKASVLINDSDMIQTACPPLHHSGLDLWKEVGIAGSGNSVMVT